MVKLPYIFKKAKGETHMVEDHTFKTTVPRPREKIGLNAENNI
jgi:hypothetical protein